MFLFRKPTFRRLVACTNPGRVKRRVSLLTSSSTFTAEVTWVSPLRATRWSSIGFLNINLFTSSSNNIDNKNYVVGHCILCILMRDKTGLLINNDDDNDGDNNNVKWWFNVVISDNNQVCDDDDDDINFFRSTWGTGQFGPTSRFCPWTTAMLPSSEHLTNLRKPSLLTVGLSRIQAC